MYDKVFIGPNKQKSRSRLFNSHESLLTASQPNYIAERVNQNLLKTHSPRRKNEAHIHKKLKQRGVFASRSLNDVNKPNDHFYGMKYRSGKYIHKQHDNNSSEIHKADDVKKHNDIYQLSKSLSLPASLRNNSTECLAQLTCSHSLDYRRPDNPIENELYEENRKVENPINPINLALPSKEAHPINRYILNNRSYEITKTNSTRECCISNCSEYITEHSTSENVTTNVSESNSPTQYLSRNRSKSSPCIELNRREQLVVGKDGDHSSSDERLSRNSEELSRSSRSLQLQKKKLLKSFSCGDQSCEVSLNKHPLFRKRTSLREEIGRRLISSSNDITDYKRNHHRENIHTDMRTKDDPFLYLHNSSNVNDQLLLSLEAASYCKHRRSSADFATCWERRYSGPDYNKGSHDIGMKENLIENVLDSKSVLLERSPFRLCRRKSLQSLTNADLKSTNNIETVKTLKGILKDSDRAFFYGDNKTSPKTIRSRNELTISPTLSHRSPPEGESAGSDMLILEQDLNDDINLYRENSVMKEFESRKIKTLLRCDSAPEKLYKDRLMQLEKERTEKERRRNSSIECRTNRVRFKLEETFKEEEERYLQLSEAENDHVTTYEEVEVFKKPLKPVTVNKIEPVEKIEVIDPPKVISPRTRKVSVFSFSEAVPVKLESKNIMVEPCKSSLESLRVDPIDCGRKMSVKEETIPVKTVASKRKKSLLTPLTKIMNSDKGSQSSVDSLGKDKSKSKPKKSLQEDNKKQKKKSKQECSPGPQRRKSSVTERKISITDTLRSVVGNNKKKKSATENPDLNNNKKSTWNAIKGKIKIERRSSANVSPTQSPRNFRFFRNDSTSSIGSSGRFKRGSLSRQNSDRSLSDSFDRKSTLSLNSEVDNEELSRTTVPYDKFKLWTGEKNDSDINTETLPLLHVACSEGNIELLKTLIDCGVDVNEIDCNGWPALHYAICSGHFNCAEVLISNGSRLKQYSNRVVNTYCSEIRKAITSK